MRRRPYLALAAVVTTVALAGTAVASTPVGGTSGSSERAARATVVGQTSPAPLREDGRCNPLTAVQVATDGPQSYTVPRPGVITRYRIRTGRDNVARMRFVLFRSPSPGSYTEVARSKYVRLQPGRVNAVKIRLRARQGDLIGYTFRGTQGSLHCQFDVGRDGNEIRLEFGDDPGVGQPFVGQPYYQRRINLAAVVEPDRDRDGYGDVSQDRCPGRAARGCERTPPQTRLTKQPPARTGARQATFRFVSNERRSRFVCSLDGGPFRSCNAPVFRTVSRGQHVFKVAAIDRWGNRDRSPAVARWRVG